MTKIKNDKRRLERLALSIPVDLKRLDVLESANVSDLTPQGVFIATEQKFDKGSRIELLLHFPTENIPADKLPEDHAVRVEGEIMWCGDKLLEDKRSVIHGIGVRFVNLNADTFEIILTLYERMHTRVS